MSKQFGVEDKYTKAALETAVEVMKMVGDNRERVAAARLCSTSVSKNLLLSQNLQSRRLKTF